MSLDENAHTEEQMPALPPPGKNVIVQCEGFRCLAYRTEDGRWMAAVGNFELKDVSEFSPIG